MTLPLDFNSMSSPFNTINTINTIAVVTFHQRVSASLAFAIMRCSSLFTTAVLASPAIAAILIPSTGSRSPSIPANAANYDSGNDHEGGDGNDDDDDTPLPIVLWHGLGDSFDSEGVRAVGELAEAIHPGTFFYPIALGADGNADRQASFFGNVTEQVSAVCAALAAHPILSTAPAIDAIGFSQGGQFLRGYVERCNRPPVRSLVTFGSQHTGIREFRACGVMDVMCRAAMALLRYNTWAAAVQGRLVPAQYFRDAGRDYDAYLQHSNFLADINNERPAKHAAYAGNIRALANFVMFMFEEDGTVIPRESSLFAEAGEDGEVVPLRETRLYTEDWLGLRALDERGGLRFRMIEGEHMRIGNKVMEQTLRDFFGPLKRTFEPESKAAAEGSKESKESWGDL
ncbi:Palmitoyl-protein thioesterase 1 [Escovopsis weberi]|uniref:Palmitoyl-protein thioesterase 1 n=1 Tax=Escovopsis weberi TaxID=150374 RepID=A0A0M8N5N6_ESCWE|nr:Palmitoyl-protein thioesterase 1 [Escovopsis weberi]